MHYVITPADSLLPTPRSRGYGPCWDHGERIIGQMRKLRTNKLHLFPHRQSFSRQTFRGGLCQAPPGKEVCREWELLWPYTQQGTRGMFNTSHAEGCRTPQDPLRAPTGAYP